MFLNQQERAMLEMTLFNLRYDTDCIGQEEEMKEELDYMTDDDIEAALNAFVAIA